ncbi:MAG: hypothetical protein AAF629_05050 [Chloroflexota bacterium]
MKNATTDGGAIALGHRSGGTGSRRVVSLINALTHRQTIYDVYYAWGQIET